jgi:hypothetical protein
MHPLRIEPKTLWKHIKVLTTKPLQLFIDKNEKVWSLLCFAKSLLILLKNSNFNVAIFLIFFCKIYSNATNKKMILKLIQ